MMDIEKLIESAEHCDLGDCANCPSCGRVCCKERTMGELAREVKRLQAENEKLRAELVKLEQMAACVYYKQGGLCRYGDEDPANVCVFGPCPHQRSAQEVLAELEQVKRERDVAIEQLHGHCPACAHYTPNHNEGPCQFCCFEVARNENVEINDNWEWRGPKEV